MESKMSYKCSKCKKDIGNYFTGEWRSIKGEKYCLDCADKIENPKNKSKKKIEHNGHTENTKCKKCGVDLGGFFTGSWGYFHCQRYCRKCLTKLRQDADKKVVQEEKHEGTYISEDNHTNEKYCHQCGVLKKGKYCHKCGTGEEEKEDKINSTKCFQCCKILTGFWIADLNPFEKMEFKSKFTLEHGESYPRFCGLTCKYKWIEYNLHNKSSSANPIAAFGKVIVILFVFVIAIILIVSGLFMMHYFTEMARIVATL